MPPLEWENPQRLKVAQYQCGYCDRLIASEWGWVTSESSSAVIYICPNCGSPSFFELPNWVGGKVVPAPRLGEAVDHLPEDVQRVYDEARRCTSSGAYTAAVMLCRKLLMHIAVEKGAKEGLQYAAYVTYLDEHGYVPPDGKAWVDQIRNLGNEANHELPDMQETDTEDALDFTGMLLKFVYEFPARRRKAPEKK
jgi:hypothetical protein